MKPSPNFLKNCFGGLLATLFGLLSIHSAHAQIFVTNRGNNTIGEYNLDGSTVNAALVSGLTGPTGLAQSGSDLFVANGIGPGGIAEYTTSGTAVYAPLVPGGNSHYPAGLAMAGSSLLVAYDIDGGNSIRTINSFSTSGATLSNSIPLISGLTDPLDIAVSGSVFFATDGQNGTVSEYNINGTTVNASLISGLNNPFGIAVSGSNIFVGTSANGGSISEYTTSGVLENASLISNLATPTAIAISGSDLFVASSSPGSGFIGEYTTSGQTINRALLQGLDEPYGLVVYVQAVPEPSTWALLLGGLGLLAYLRKRTRRTSQ